MNRTAKLMCAAATAAAMALGAVAENVWDGYTQLTWLETDGSNWIDTGVKARSGLVFGGKITMLSVDPN